MSVVRTKYRHLDIRDLVYPITIIELILLYLACRTGQSVVLTVIGNSVFTVSRDCCLSLSRDQRK